MTVILSNSKEMTHPHMMVRTLILSKPFRNAYNNYTMTHDFTSTVHGLK